MGRFSMHPTPTAPEKTSNVEKSQSKFHTAKTKRLSGLCEQQEYKASEDNSTVDNDDYGEEHQVRHLLMRTSQIKPL